MGNPKSASMTVSYAARQKSLQNVNVNKTNHKSIEMDTLLVYDIVEVVSGTIALLVRNVKKI